MIGQKLFLFIEGVNNKHGSTRPTHFSRLPVHYIGIPPSSFISQMILLKLIKIFLPHPVYVDSSIFVFRFDDIASV